MSETPSYYKKVVSVTIVAGGSEYTSAPEVSFVGGKSGTSSSAFSTAAGTAIIENGSVVAVEITNDGFDYVSTPEVVFSGGGGAGATATANLLPIDSIYGDFAGSLSHLIQHQVPSYIRQEYPQFVLFLEKYYEFLEQDNQANNILLKLESFSDIHRTLDMFIPMFRSQYLKYFPKKTSIDERLLIKFIREFYEAKGSTKSIEFLFRLLFDEHAEVFYPSEYILRASDGVWLKDNVIRVTARDGLNPFDLHGQIVDILSYTSIGSITTETKTEVIVYDVRKIAYTNPAIYELLIDKPITVPVPGSGAVATALLNSSYEISSIRVDAEGAGYYAAPKIIINSYTGGGASARASVSSDGKVTAINLNTVDSVVQRGSHYGGTNSNGNNYYFDSFNYMSDTDWAGVGDQTFRYNAQNAADVTEIYVSTTGAFKDVSDWLTSIADDITSAGNLGFFTVFSATKEYLFKVVDAAVDNTALYGYWKFIVEYQWGADSELDFAEPVTLAFSNTLTLPAVEFSVDDVLTTVSTKSGTLYGNLLRILSTVQATDVEAYLAPGETSYGFKVNTLYDITESGSSGAYALSDYFAGDYVGIGINNKASVKIVAVDNVGFPTKVEIAFSGYGFQQETFSTEIISPNGSSVVLICTTGSSYTTAGRFKDSRGFLSDANHLQDNKYYQTYSYVIRSGISSRIWMDVVKNTVHPAGMAVFGELIINEYVDFGTNIMSITENVQFYRDPFDIVTVDTYSFTVTFAKALVDTVTSADTIVKAVNRPVTDSTTNADSYVILTNKVFNEYQITNDVITSKVIEKVLTDTVITDDTSLLVARAMEQGDAYSASDSSIIQVDKALTELQTTTETTTLVVAKTLTDTGTTSETIVKVADKVLSDTASWTEEIAKLYEKTVSDSANTTETGLINNQDYWSSDYVTGIGATGDYVGNNSTF